MQVKSETHRDISHKNKVTVYLVTFICGFLVTVGVLVYIYWQPAFVIGGFDSEWIAFTSHQWSGDTSVNITVKNPSHYDVTIANVLVNGRNASYTTSPSNGFLPKGSSGTIVITQSFTPGTQYAFMVVTAYGNELGPCTLTAP
jgi:P pilus assembly chaperone PapD